MSTWAIVPFRGPHNAKKRLSNELSGATRAELALTMLDDVLDALTHTESLDGTLLVSKSPAAKDIAQRWDIALYQERALTLAGALTEASAKLMRDMHARTTVIVPGDLPLISPSEIERLLGHHEDVVIVPDHNKLGTNALVCTPPDAIRYIFDGRSYQPHLEEARRNQRRVRTVISESLGLDVDTISDLNKVTKSAATSRTKQLLSKHTAFNTLLAS